MNDKLQIIDINNLKITKVKSWAIYFDYDREKYLFHQSEEDYECWNTLYHRIKENKFGKYRLEDMEGEETLTNHGLYEYLEKFRTKNGSYNTIKCKEGFCKKMTYSGYFDGLYYEEIDKTRKEIRLLKFQINEMEKEFKLKTRWHTNRLSKLKKLY